MVMTQIVAPDQIRTRVVSESTAIPKGTILKFTGAANTAAASAADGDAFAGITIEEFAGGEGLTHVGVAFDSGVFQMATTAAAIVIGARVSIGGSQTIAVSVGTADLVDGSQFGRSEEVRSGTNSIRVRLLGG